MRDDERDSINYGGRNSEPKELRSCRGIASAVCFSSRHSSDNVS
jgi:hypothetical protein